MPMKRLLFISLLAFVPFTTSCDAVGSECCVVCNTGKACGNNCIDESLTCPFEAGCACND